MPGIVQLVHVDQDGAGRPVPGELIQQLAKVDVAMIAQGDEGREADFALFGPIQDGGADRCRLGEKRHLSRSRCNGEKLALIPCPGSSMPMLLGPSSRMPYCWHRCLAAGARQWRTGRPV